MKSELTENKINDTMPLIKDFKNYAWVTVNSTLYENPWVLYDARVSQMKLVEEIERGKYERNNKRCG